MASVDSHVCRVRIMVWHFSWLLMECVVTQNGTCFMLPKVSYAIIVAIYSQGRLDITNIYKYRIWIQLHIASYSSSCSYHFSLSCLSFKPFKPYFDRPGTGQPQPPTFLAESPVDPLPSCFQRMHSTRRCHSLVLLVTLEHIISICWIRWWIIRMVVYYSKNLQNMYSWILWNISPCFSKIVLLHQPTYHLSLQPWSAVVKRHQQQQLPVNLKNEWT